MSNVHLAPKLAVVMVAATMASAAFAQTSRGSVDATASSGTTEFRDRKTGQV